MKTNLASMGEPAAPRRSPIFYGWWIVGAGALISAINGAVYFYGMSVFFTPLLQEFGWSRTALSGAFSISRLEAGVAGPVAGICIDRWGPRRMMLIGLSLMGVGFLFLSRIDSLEAFYFVFIVFLSLGAGLGVTPAVSASVTSWFIRRRGLALSLVLCGYGLGGMLSSVLGYLINTYGWRTTLVQIGVFVLVTGLPLALVMRHRPEQYGLLPDGAASPSVSTVAAPAAPPEAGFEPREALRTSAFWLLALMFGLRQITTTGALIHLPTLLVDRGFPLETAAAILGVVALISLPGRLLCGWLSDRVEKRYVFGACMALLTFSMLVLANGTTMLHLGVFMVAYGLSYGGSLPTVMALVADYFGRRRYATIYGFAQFAMMWGTIGGPLLAGYAFDTTGSYLVALNIFAAANALGMLVAFVARPPRRAIPCC